jgi:Leucine-rich repeat (LRR) protein
MELKKKIRNNEYKIKYDTLYNPKWSDDELIKHVIELDCSRHQLTILPNLPNCQKLWCEYNQLTTLPDLPNCQILFCYNNQLTTLPCPRSGRLC